MGQEYVYSSKIVDDDTGALVDLTGVNELDINGVRWVRKTQESIEDTAALLPPDHTEPKGGTDAQK